ncbi:MAG: hypothetical protein Q4F49_05005 [Pseudoxanthomonas suwonensis]|nr:hypothetical protein [Pseudoxanthomonas suwonensis]
MSGKSSQTSSNTTTATLSSRRSRAPATSLSSETIAADIAAFKKRGGRIDILGNTPMRPHDSPYRSRATQATATAATKVAAKTATERPATRKRVR